MNRAARWLLAVVLMQTALLGLYWFVERRRAPAVALGTEPPRRTDLPCPALAVRRTDGSAGDLCALAGPALVHVWASWCPACRVELPHLLELPQRHGIDVVTLSLDENWNRAERFLDGADPSRVFLADGQEVAQRLGVHELPVTFLLDARGRIVQRFDGARDWTNESFIDSHIRNYFRN